MKVMRLATAVFLFGGTVSPGSAASPPDLPALARRAISSEPEVARRARRTLREAGPAGLQALIELRSSSPRWTEAVEAVAAQRDAGASLLYWYTDLDRALAAARESGRPVLSLRLLGRLDEELSCANSRFFRTILYPDAEVSRALRERFVLHWQSERPVPRVTIDMGDGRKLEGTVTGNSIHYVLDARGRVVDALPGLYAPRVFLALLGAAERTAREVNGLEDARWASRVGFRHLESLQALEASLPPPAGTAVVAVPTAAEAARLAMSKARLERPLVEAVSFDKVDTALPGRVAYLAGRFAKAARLDANSRALLLRKHEARAREYGAPPADPDGVIASFERSLAEDTAFNEYALHRQLRAWFAQARAPLSLAELNARVYAELFLTPASDPWLGLFAPDTYAALEPAGG
jgi:hypothetical protein